MKFVKHMFGVCQHVVSMLFCVIITHLDDFNINGKFRNIFVINEQILFFQRVPTIL